jgi:hypothetical protein
MLALWFQTPETTAARHQSLWLQIPEIIIIPLVALFIITLIKAATAAKPFENDQAVDIGMDLSVLATGACGSVFANDTLYNKWGMSLIIYGVLVVLLCISFIGILAIIRRWRNFPPVSNGKAIRNALIGAVPLGLVTALLVLGYTVRVGR